MTQTPAGPAKKCEFCDKRGLPLLLVRDAVAPAAGGAPLSNDPAIDLNTSAAHYTKRILRAGYLNLYDEARKRWETYFVTSDGYLFKLAQTAGVLQVVPTRPFNCPDEGHRAVASCITIPDPKNATKVWIGFSDVVWTDAVRKRHSDSAYRKRHMVAIDVKAALAGGKVAGARPIAQVDAVVAEYAMDARKGATLFAWSAAPYAARHGRGARLRAECDALRLDKGLIVTLPDPAGIAQDLALLMHRNAELFTNSPDNKRKLAANGAIAQIEMGIRVAAEKQYMRDAQGAANRAISDAGVAYALSQKLRDSIERMRNVTKEELQRAGDERWTRYLKKFDDKARVAWEQDFNKRLHAFNDNHIAPLATCHVAWMRSTAMVAYFECNYDTEHPESGGVYTEMVTRCIAKTQDKLACARLYDEWLDGTADDPKNFLLRAMMFNQKTIIQAVTMAADVTLSLRQIPWDNLFSTYTVSVERMGRGAQDGAARLMVESAGSVAKALGKVMDGSSRFRALFMTTGLISGHPIVLVEVTGSKKAFRAQIIKELLKASGQSISKSKMNFAVAEELRRLQVQGVPLDGTTKKAWMLPADSEYLRNVPAGLNEGQRAEYLAKSLRKIEQIEAMNLDRWRKVINTDVRFGIVTGILQALCLTKSVEDQEKAMDNEKFDATTRMYLGVTALVGTTAEVLGSALAGRAALGMPFGQGLAAGAGAFLKVAGKGAGVAAGLIMAVMDFRKAAESFKEEQTGLAWAYVGSGAVGILLTGAILWAVALPIIGLLIAILIGIAILIEYVKDNALQDWLERTPWGRLVDQRYSSFETEQAQLQHAIRE
ncbi:hypothetical protein KY495_13095 [Massilia sp. PAMC28688]|uniref:T6SS effector BTH_I2691 family protein n=1 Tax=Massilia sp. PAMC28688 TaxID=2861283 RepID=UPI001C639E67|nr:T6SS effector BTH_I2691 family protein [Massilia sp. PAMC28688]QYF91735.1 hypothetical protein KY495_13095 [Massilia sp. PAMC28688]